ncbi:hypothetical protein [Pseudomonas aeruginosa]|uniref:hypothetical protein n=1 Tax=Pseudomonas aeruginosa TaxID=287 RepID=UPI000D69BDC7|nr:hypothetical protein [Pseudomonas aeruginosa]
MTESKICTCPSGDGSLRWPCPAHPAEQAGGDERAAFELFVRKHCGMPAHIAVNWDAKFTNDAWTGWQARAALAQPSPAPAEAERPEVVAVVRAQGFGRVCEAIDVDTLYQHCSEGEPLMTVAQHDRIVGELRAVITQLRQHKNDYMDAGQETYRALQNEIREREAEIARLDCLVSSRTAERDAALARVAALESKLAELEKQEPVAWLDVQAERRRQVEAEGWTPEHDDEHSHGQMARAAACYALAGSSAPNDGTAALLVSLAWPWDQQWWKPTSARRDLIKAGALILAEIERLDRAAHGKEGV